jgi:acetyl-CoA carboxylase biotin carboxyl carrier protein
VPEDKLTYDDLLQVLEVIKASERFSEVKVKVGEMEVVLRRGAPQPGEAPRAPSPSAAPAATAPAPAAQAAPAAPPAQTEETFPAGAVLIRSPMIGIFYRAPEPGAKPFVETGQAVEPDTVVCLIEVMKLFNSIPAGCRGRITRILASNADPVEYGQVLMVVEPG